MKRMLTALIALALLLTSALPALAELPDCFVPTTMMIGFNTRLPGLFRTLGGANAAALTSKYMLSNPEMLSNGMRFSNDDGNVALEAQGLSGGPTSPAKRVALTIGSGVNAIYASALKQAFLGVVADSDKSVAYKDLLAWVPDAAKNGPLALGGYTLSFERAGGGQSLVLSVGDAPASTATPAPTATPKPAPTATPKPTATATPAPTVAPDGEPKSGFSEGQFASLFGGQKSEPEATPTATPGPTATPAPTPGSLEGAALEWNGFSLQPLRYDITAYSSDYVRMNLFFRVQNHTDKLIWVDVDGITIDGNTQVRSTSICKSVAFSDTGDRDARHALITSDTASGLQAIADAQKVKLTISLKDEHFDRLYTQDISVDLSALEGKRDVPDGFKAVSPTVTPKPTTSSGGGRTAPSYTPASTDYKTLKPGNKGRAVRDLQQRLIDLGYLNGKADGSYGKKTTAAVRTFCEQNNLSTDGSNASPQMQARLFSSSAKYYSEAYIPLVIGATSKYDPVKSANTFFFKTQVINTSKTRTVKGFELKCYSTDVWGKKLDNGVVYSMTNTKTVRPGETAWSNSFNLGNWFTVDIVWIGISRIVFDDGEIRDVDDVEYYSCSIPGRK